MTTDLCMRDYRSRNRKSKMNLRNSLSLVSIRENSKSIQISEAATDKAYHHEMSNFTI